MLNRISCSTCPDRTPSPLVQPQPISNGCPSPPPTRCLIQKHQDIPRLGPDHHSSADSPADSCRASRSDLLRCSSYTSLRLTRNPKTAKARLRLFVQKEKVKWLGQIRAPQGWRGCSSPSLWPRKAHTAALSIAAACREAACACLSSAVRSRLGLRGLRSARPTARVSLIKEQVTSLLTSKELVVLVGSYFKRTHWVPGEVHSCARTKMQTGTVVWVCHETTNHKD